MLGAVEDLLRSPLVRGAYDKLDRTTKPYPAPEDVETEYLVRQAMLDGRLPSIIENASKLANEALKFEHVIADDDSSQMRRLVTLRDCLQQVSSLLKGEKIDDFVHDHTEGRHWTPGTTRLTWPSMPSVKVKKAGNASDQLVPVGTVDIFPPQAAAFTLPADGRTIKRDDYPDFKGVPDGWTYRHDADGKLWLDLPDERENVIDIDVSDEGDVTAPVIDAAADAIDRGNAFSYIKRIRNISADNTADINDDWDKVNTLAVDAMNILKGDRDA